VFFSVFFIVLNAHTHYFLLRLVADTRLGFPAGCPNLFFSATFFFFSALDISPEVLGVFSDTRLLGRQYGVPRPSPFFLPQALPVLTSFQSSLNQRFKDAPFSVLRIFLRITYRPFSSGI
jgi:hypothetical protein